MIRKVLSFVAKYSLRVNLAFRTIDQNFCVEYEPGMFHFLVHHHEQCLQLNCIWCVCWFCDFPVLKFRQSRHFWKKKNLVSLKFIKNKTYLIGKLTIVGFFSRKNVFLVKRFIHKIINFGNFVISNLFKKLSL